jgi:hypothetical protein
VGQVVTVEGFQVGEHVKVTGVSKGKASKALSSAMARRADRLPRIPFSPHNGSIVKERRPASL